MAKKVLKQEIKKESTSLEATPVIASENQSTDSPVIASNEVAKQSTQEASDSLPCHVEPLGETSLQDVNKKDSSPAKQVQNDKWDSFLQNDKEKDVIASEKQSNTESNAKDLQTFISELDPKEQAILKRFMTTQVYDKLINHLQSFFNNEKVTQTAQIINSYGFRAKEDFSIRISNKVYNIKKGCLIYSPKDAYGIKLLKDSRVERVF